MLTRTVDSVARLFPKYDTMNESIVVQPQLTILEPATVWTLFVRLLLLPRKATSRPSPLPLLVSGGHSHHLQM